MSEVQIEEVQTELETVKNQLKNVNAEKDAAKQMYNEYANSNLQLRSSLIILQQQLYDQQQTITNLNSQIQTLTNKMLELHPPKKDEVITPILKEKKS